MSIRIGDKIIASATNSVDVDGVTITQDDSGIITAIGLKAQTEETVINWIGTEAEYEVGIADGSISDDWFCYITDDELTSDNFANVELDNIVELGKSQYNVFCVNTGETDDSGNPTFLSYEDGVLTTSGTFVCTLANGTIYTISDNVLTLDVSDYDSGTYNVFIDPVNLQIVVLANSVYVGTVMPDGATEGDILLNTSKVPYYLEQYGSDEEPTYVYAGTLEI